MRPVTALISSRSGLLVSVLHELLEKADASLKSPELNWGDIHSGRESIGEALKMVSTRMEMIERIDGHPLSWPVATEFQKLKRAKTGNLEDEKLFVQAEKKVAEDRKKREEAAGGQRASTARGFDRDRFHYSKRPAPGFLPFFSALFCSWLITL